jgi:hypothetical protein
MYIKHILPLLLVALIGAGCDRAVKTVGGFDTLRVVQRKTPSVPTTGTDFLAASKLSNENQDEVISGILARELSQITGIKIWTVDANHVPIKQVNSWIWVVPATPDDPTGNKDWDGNWSLYMLEKYAGITRAQYEKIDFDKTLITVTGKSLKDDCDIVSDDNNMVCITNFETKSISLKAF